MTDNPVIQINSIDCIRDFQVQKDDKDWKDPKVIK